MEGREKCRSEAAKLTTHASGHDTTTARIGDGRPHRPPPYSGVVSVAHTEPLARPASVAVAEAALVRLLAGDLSDGERTALVETVRAVLGVSTSDRVRATGRAGWAGSREVLPFVRAMAELVIDVEELAANGASSRAVIHRVRAQARQVGLDPIDRTGERSAMDRSRHRSVGAAIGDGTPVVVVRPGYVWRSRTGTVVVAKAVVQDRS